jgi:hypothetical protein
MGASRLDRAYHLTAGFNGVPPHHGGAYLIRLQLMAVLIDSHRRLNVCVDKQRSEGRD